MGTLLVRRVEALGMAGRLNGIPPRSVAGLYVMALNAHDTGTKRFPAGVYFRGWDHLAAAVGYGDGASPDAAHKAAMRVIRDLTAAGLVKAEGRIYGAKHGQMCYRLTL